MIESKIVKVTPDYANILLSKNSSNRPINEKHVHFLASSISRGEWQLNGESIKISDCGTLLDGQHRLSAVVKSGCGIDSIIISGLPVDSFHTINVGAKVRSASDILYISGEKNYAALASGARYFKCWEKNKKLPKFRNTTISVSEIEDVIFRHPNIRNYANFKRGGLKKILSSGIGCFLGYLFSCANKEKSDEFFDLLCTGAGLESGSPILLLRDRLMSNAQSTSKIHGEIIIALTIKAFNAYVDNNKIGVLRFKENERFPIISGYEA